MTRSTTNPPRGPSPDLPKWVKPQLCKLVDAPPQGPEWLHEIKYDGYRMHARLERGRVSLLTRTGLDWTHKYPSIAAAVSALPAKQAYLDGELCGITRDGKTSFSLIQTASDSGNADALIFFLFDLLYLDGEVISAAPLRGRKERLRDLLSKAGAPLQYSDHQVGRGPAFLCEGLRVVAGRHHLQARGRALFARRSRVMGEGEMPKPRGVRGGRLDRSRRLASLARCAALGVLRPARAACLCWPRRNRNWSSGTRPAMASAATSRHFRDAAAGGAAPLEPIRFTACPQSRALGSARACRGGQIPELGQTITCFVRSFTMVCERTRSRPTSSVPCRTNHRPRAAGLFRL
jgi:ATP dependent DNA ligase domain